MTLLDMRTIIFSHVIIDFVCMTVILMLWYQTRKRFAGTNLWVFAFAFQTAAVLLIVLRSGIPDWMSLILSNTLIVAGAILGYMGLVRFVEERISQVHNYVLLAVFACIHTYFVLVQPNLSARGLNLSAGLLIICFQRMWFLLYGVKPSMRRLTFGVAIVNGGYCLVSIVEIIKVLTGRYAANDLFQSGTFEALILLSLQMLYILFTYSLVLMVNKRLLVEVNTEEEKFAKAFRSSPYAITISRISDGQIVEVNDGFVDITGYQYEEAIGKTTVDLHLWEKEGDRVDAISELSNGGKVQGREFQFRKKSDEMFLGLFSAEIIPFDEQKCVLSSISDITSRKRAEEKANRSARENAIIAEIGQIIGSTLNIDEIYALFSAKVKDLIPYDRIAVNLIGNDGVTLINRYVEGDPAPGRNLGDVFPMVGTLTEAMIRTRKGSIVEGQKEDEMAAKYAGLLPEFKAGFRSFLSIPLISRDNVIGGLHLRSRGFRTYSEKDLKLGQSVANQIAGAISSAQLVAERQRLEGRLNRAEKMEAVGTLAGGVAHDLNNVLGVLVGYSELLLMEISEGSLLRKHVSQILQAGQRAAAIIQDLLTLARRGVTVSEVVNLNKVISDYFKTPEFEKLKAYHPAVTFKTDLDKDLMNVKGSPVHLGKTIMNLLSNAAEAISDHGEVTLLTENRYLDKPIAGYDHIEEGEYVVLRVSDNGKGISGGDIGKIFEPFYTKKVMGRSGTGLGLAVVWGTVKDHGGYIDVQSKEGKEAPSRSTSQLLGRRWSKISHRYRPNLTGEEENQSWWWTM